jgi:asparaginyl-tRNA synthetase
VKPGVREPGLREPRVRDLLRRPAAGGDVVVRGWLKTARHAKERSFLELTDGSSLAGIQAVVEHDLPNYETEVRELRAGEAVCVTGELRDSPATGQRFEVAARSVEVVGRVGEDYALQKKRHTFEYLRTIGHLRPRTNTIGAVWRVRDAAAHAIHAFFRERGFVWLHAPIVSRADTEGAGALFRVTTLDAANPPRAADGGVDFAQDFFGGEAHLTVSGQLEAEIGALALTDVYTFGPTFRAEHSTTPRHLAEFWMVEPEMAFCDLDGAVSLAEAFLKHVFAAVLEACPEDMSFFAERIDPKVIDVLRHVIESPFERLTYTEAIQRLERSGRAFEFPVAWGADLQSEHERWLAEEHVGRPLVVTDYPKQIKAFYMYVNDDGRTVRAMDVLVPRIGEIVGGSQREDRVEVLRGRIAEAGLREADYAWYLELRRHGSVPHAGFGVGFERMVQFMTGLANIREVIPFPRVPGSAEF